MVIHTAAISAHIETWQIQILILVVDRFRDYSSPRPQQRERKWLEWVTSPMEKISGLTVHSHCGVMQIIPWHLRVVTAGFLAVNKASLASLSQPPSTVIPSSNPIQPQFHTSAFLAFKQFRKRIQINRPSSATMAGLHVNHKVSRSCTPFYQSCPPPLVRAYTT